jgi:hypothetical protein
MVTYPVKLRLNFLCRGLCDSPLEGCRGLFVYFSFWSVFSPYHYVSAYGQCFHRTTYNNHLSLTRRLAGAVKTPTKS